MPAPPRPPEQDLAAAAGRHHVNGDLAATIISRDSTTAIRLPPAPAGAAVGFDRSAFVVAAVVIYPPLPPAAPRP
jgi:hypothetical protein